MNVVPRFDGSCRKTRRQKAAITAKRSGFCGTSSGARDNRIFKFQPPILRLSGALFHYSKGTASQVAPVLPCKSLPLTTLGQSAIVAVAAVLKSIPLFFRSRLAAFCFGDYASAGTSAMARTTTPRLLGSVMLRTVLLLSRSNE